MAGVNHHLAVAGIDFGTTYCGWTLSYQHDFERDPLKILVKSWNNGDNISLKQPTTLLIKPDGKTMDSFGYEAESRYADILDNEKEIQDYYYFHRFKMILYKQENISRTMELEAVDGRKLPAILVFQLAIGYLKDNILEECSTMIRGGLRVTDIHWCLTVPAIWNDKAKKFMREAAIKAGINSFDLTIVLEPEGASAYCKYVPFEKSNSGNTAAMEPGSSYILIDCGGGTTDICCHQILEDRKLKEIHRVSGDNIGGTDVDKAFEELMVMIFGQKVWDEFRRDNKGDLLDFFRTFEVKKRNIQHTNGKPITITLPLELVNILVSKTKQNVNDAVDNAGLNLNIKVLKGNKIQVDNDFLRSKTFESTEARLHDLLKGLCTNPKLEETRTVLLVGGFSESPVIREAVRKALPDRQVITVQDGSLAVVKGAVIYGHDNSVVQSRVVRYTYGESMYYNFDATLHDESKSWIGEDGTKLVKRFATLITAGQDLPSDHKISGEDGCPTDEDQTTIITSIYAIDADDEIPKYIDDPRCIYLGKICCPISNMSVPLHERGISTEYKFGGTELFATVTEISTGISTEGSVDFLG